MKVDGNKIAEEILDVVAHLGGPQKKLAIIQIGNLRESTTYVRAKKRVGERVGVKVDHYCFREETSEKNIIERIAKLNSDTTVTGIIVQLPLPHNLNTQKILTAIDPKKDVDGFLPNSPYTPPVARAVLIIINVVMSFNKLYSWRTKNIVVIGRGKTAGAPIHKSLKKLKIPTTLVHSKTPNPARILRKAELIISCVGKPNIITPEKIKKGVILIGVGIHRDKNGNLRGDYDEDKIKDKAAYYTPTPGGVGPVTVACLLQNVVNRC